MKKTWPFSQVLLLGSILIAIGAVVITVFMTNVTLRSVEKNLPSTLMKELVSLDQVLGDLSEVVFAARMNAASPVPLNFEILKKKIDTAFDSISSLRQTYVFDNLIHASKFHAVVAPAVSDLQTWMSEGISGYGPRSDTTARILLSRISSATEKARELNRQSRLNAEKKLSDERKRLDRFLYSVNQLFMLTLFIVLIMVALFIHQRILKGREVKILEAMKHQRDLLNTLFENILLGITVWDSKGSLLFVNSYFTRLTGYSVQDIPRVRDWFDRAFPDPDYREKVLGTWKNAVKQGTEIREFKVRCKNGETKDIEFRGTIMPDQRVLVSMADITEKKSLEIQYEQAQKMESLGTLAGGIAHDFNNLLSGIYGYMDLARLKTDDPGIKEYLEKAHKSSERAKGLTYQLLTFSKGGAPVKKVESLIPFLEETALFALSGADISCSFDLAEDLWMCDYDKSQMGQVIENIIINAHHAMPSGGKIEMKAENTVLREREHPGLGPGRYIKISVSDSGIGIPRNYLSRIFEPFFTTKQKGSGLGLATSYSIVKRHGGSIDVKSRLGEGTTFTLFIPASVRQGVENRDEIENLYQGHGKILIMDDEEMILEMLTDMIETMGFSVESTGDGVKALDVWERNAGGSQAFRAVILDLTVPGGMGGRETIQEIRRTDKDLPVFVASGYSEDEVMADPGAFGFTASIQKPFTVQDISRIFERYLSPGGNDRAGGPGL
ncbi:hybrid sensor histidine kinase/response regulator [Desulfospira joergensenii]|uniref:hybrid sensor histidine kinase/response regulator n=1 Tax=Desulfospira joergensenii TaxID=53329 RepID=UPI0003B63850|nr:ATP-binding protein [Desulfospira joergensenii]